MHGDNEKFFPAGWCNDMASGNFIGWVKIYGEDILETVTGCEFHFRNPVNRKAKLFGELKEKYVTEALPLLTVTTPGAYDAARHQFKLFLNNEAPSVHVFSWLDRWHDCRKLILGVFTLKELHSINMLVIILLLLWLSKERLACFFKHILFLLKYVLRIDRSSELLKNRYFSNDDVKACLYNNPINAIYQQYVQIVEKSKRNKRNLQEIILNYPLYNQPQKFRLMHKAIWSAKCHGRCCNDH